MSSDNEFSSSPCMWHELADLEAGSAGAGDASREIGDWRKAERKKQIESRRATILGDRQHMSERIRSRFMRAAPTAPGSCVSLYWPIRAEPDLRALAEHIMSAEGTCALPVVVERGKPLEFHSWEPGERLVRGFWNIPVPAAGRQVVPDVVVAPVVAFDRSCYRLGYGGGYFDRTLAALRNRPLVVGVGFSSAEIPTIHPQSHDIPMDLIITERETIERGDLTR